MGQTLQTRAIAAKTWFTTNFVIAPHMCSAVFPTPSPSAGSRLRKRDDEQRANTLTGFSCSMCRMTNNSSKRVLSRPTLTFRGSKRTASRIGGIRSFHLLQKMRMFLLQTGIRLLCRYRKISRLIMRRLGDYLEACKLVVISGMMLDFGSRS